jgi:DNA-binding Xre family transcriptional regulator
MGLLRLQQPHFYSSSNFPILNLNISIIIIVNMEGIAMIIFDRLWKIMGERNFSTYYLREQCGIDHKTVRRLRTNQNMKTKTLNRISAALGCKLEDIAEYIPD